MREYTIKIKVSVDDSNQIEIKMNADKDIKAFDFIRVMNSLSETVGNMTEKFTNEHDEINSMDDAENISLDDLGVG